MQDMQARAQDRESTHLLTTREVQSLIKVDRSTVYRMAEDGRLPAVKVGRQWRFPEADLQEWLRGRRPSATRQPATTPALPLSQPALQAAADFLGEALGTMIVLTDLQGRPLVAPANPCGLFHALHGYPGVLERCITGWHTLAAEPDLLPQWRVTPLGFLCARSLVRDGDRLVAMVLAGGVAPDHWPPEPDEAARLADDMGVPASAMADHATEVFRLDDQQMGRVLNLLPRAAAFLSRLLNPENEPSRAPTPNAPPATSSP